MSFNPSFCKLSHKIVYKPQLYQFALQYIITKYPVDKIQATISICSSAGLLIISMFNIIHLTKLSR